MRKGQPRANRADMRYDQLTMRCTLGTVLAFVLFAPSCGARTSVGDESAPVELDASEGSDASAGVDADADASLQEIAPADAPVVDQGKPPDVEPICAPGAHLCTGKILLVCNSSGTGYDPLQTCPYACLADQGLCQVCAPGIKGCLDDKTVSVCSADGLIQTASPCAAHPYCLDGACVGCVEDAHCDYAAKPCHPAFCDGNHACATSVQPLGAPCSIGQCDATGACCAVQVFPAQLKTLDIYIMADRSGSMDGQNWANQSDALNGFFGAPESAGMWVALKFFPLSDDSGAANPGCTGEAYSKPLVDWGVLPGNAAALAKAITDTTPTGVFTPTQEALTGALLEAKARQIDHPDHVVVALLISDGQPCCSDCPYEGALGLGSIAYQYYTGVPSIQTFTVYVNNVANIVMNGIAKGGGTGQAYDGTGGVQQLLAALNAIQTKAVPCSVDLPQPDAGTIDPAAVSVTYTNGGSSTATVVQKVATKSDCGAAGGWYFDDASLPKKVEFCEATCTELKGDASGKVELYYGCGAK